MCGMSLYMVGQGSFYGYKINDYMLSSSRQQSTQKHHYSRTICTQMKGDDVPNVMEPDILCTQHVIKTMYRSNGR